MLFKNLLLFNGKKFNCLLPPSSSSLQKGGIKFSSSSSSSSWVENNQLFQRHPRLQLLLGHQQQQQCNTTLHHFKQLLSYVFISGLHRNQFVISRLLYITLVQDNQDKLEFFGVHIFNHIGKPNIFSWNTIIRFFASSSRCPHIALLYYMKMLSQQDMLPDNYTFTFLLQASCGLAFVKQLHSHIVKLGFDRDLFVQNSLLNAVLTRRGPLVDAQSLFDEMDDKDVVSWTSFISGLVSQSNYPEAFRVFNRVMVDYQLVRPNVATMLSTMAVCAKLGSIDHTRCMHALLEKAGWLESDVSVSNSLIDAYAKCGDLCQAQKAFNDINGIKRDLYSWTTIISGFAMHGRGFDTVNLLSHMEQRCGLIPDAVTFIALLSACAHSGLVEEGLHMFESMRTQYKIEPDLRHYGCIVDLLGRAGMLDRAFSIVKNMALEPNLAILGSLLNGCRLQNNVELGEAVLRKIELLKERGGAPVLLSNIYADGNQWSKVIHMRKEMRETVKGKFLGSSWI